MRVASGLLQLGRAAKAIAPAREAAKAWEKGPGPSPPAFTMRPAAALWPPRQSAATDKSVEGAKAADTEADQAVALLNQAVSAGWSNAAFVAADHDLDGLRGRDDFQAVVARLGDASRLHGNR